MQREVTPGGKAGHEMTRKQKLRRIASPFIGIVAGAAIMQLYLGPILKNYDNHVRAKEFAASLKVEPPLVSPKFLKRDEKTGVTFTVSVSDTVVTATVTTTKKNNTVTSATETSTRVSDYKFNLGLSSRDWGDIDKAKKAIEEKGGKVIETKREMWIPPALGP